MSLQSPASSLQPALLAIHSGALGDIVLFAHFLTAVRAPGERVSLAAGSEIGRLLVELGVVDQCLDFSTLPMHELFNPSGPAADDPLARRLGNCDRLISCFGAGDEAAQARLVSLTGATSSLFLPVRPGKQHVSHLLDFWADRAQLDEPARQRLARPPLWQATPELKRLGRAAVQQIGVSDPGGFAVLHVGSGSPAKCWPAERFEALADQLDLPAIFVVGPVEVERLGEERLAQWATRRPVLVSPSLAELAGMLAEAAIFVGNDSGPGHLAAALGTPTLVLFGPTDPAHFAPRGRCVKVLSGPSLVELPIAAVARAAAQLCAG